MDFLRSLGGLFAQTPNEIIEVKTKQEWFDYLNDRTVMWPQSRCNDCNGVTNKCRCAEIYFRFSYTKKVNGGTILFVPDDVPDDLLTKQNRRD